MNARYGMTIPLGGGPLHAQRACLEELAACGYTDLWSSEADGTDGFTPLVLASTWTPSMRLGCAIFPAYTRGPALMAMSVASLCQAAPGRCVIGIGSSSNVIVENWNGIPFEKPYQRNRDTVRFLKAALAGGKVTEEYETFSVRNFRLRVDVDEPPKILIAALREGMLNLAGRESDGTILNWLSPEDVSKVVPIVKQHGEDKEIVARIFVCPNEDRDAVRAMGRFAANAYLNVPVYAAFHQWLGREALLADTWAQWSAGDRKGAAASIPDSVVDDLIVHGSIEECREGIQRYVDNGVDTPVLSIMPLGMDPLEAARALAPG
ncbi:LLM class F420-dependent oxidoreductase [Myxococcota bacterium]|nr:LLM class F420-dependent oxidoreductase [Myxococcota bacterium]